VVIGGELDAGAAAVRVAGRAAAGAAAAHLAGGAGVPAGAAVARVDLRARARPRAQRVAGLAGGAGASNEPVAKHSGADWAAALGTTTEAIRDGTKRSPMGFRNRRFILELIQLKA